MNRKERRKQAQIDNSAKSKRIYEQGRHAYNVAKAGTENPENYLDTLAELYAAQMACIMIDESMLQLEKLLSVYDVGREFKTRVLRLQKDTNKLLHDIRLDLVHGKLEDDYENTMRSAYHLRDLAVAAFRKSFSASHIKAFNKGFDKLTERIEYPNAIINDVRATFAATCRKWETAYGEQAN